MKRLIGPFSQIITMSNLPLKGSITDEKLEIIENGGVIIDGNKILDLRKGHVILTIQNISDYGAKISENEFYLNFEQYQEKI